MEKISKSKYFLVFSFILIIAVLFYLFNLQKPEPPYQVLTPESYQPGTTVSLYKDVPPGFPGEVVLEDNPLNSSTVVTGTGKTQMKVSYESAQKVAELLPIYEETLLQKGWTVFINSSSAKAATLVVTKDGKNVLITIADSKQAGTSFKSLVTFQYDK